MLFLLMPKASQLFASLIDRVKHKHHALNQRMRRKHISQTEKSTALLLLVNLIMSLFYILISDIVIVLLTFIGFILFLVVEVEERDIEALLDLAVEVEFLQEVVFPLLWFLVAIKSM